VAGTGLVGGKSHEREVRSVGNYARKKPILAKYNLILDTTAAQ
jgi:hypothetical protein